MEDIMNLLKDFVTLVAAAGYIWNGAKWAAKYLPEGWKSLRKQLKKLK